MTGPNLSRACQTLNITKTMWVVNLATGKMIGMPMEQYLIMNASAFEGHAAYCDETQAALAQTRVLAAIANRN